MANLKGTLKLTVAAGSAGAGVPAGDAVTVLLVREGMAAERRELKTDDAGKLTVEDIPLMPPVEVVVQIHHGGLTQQAEVQALTPGAPERSLELKVFEPTEEAPAWRVAMRHVFVEYSEDKTQAVVMEMMQVTNPGDRVWIGAKGAAGMGEKRVTLTIPVPAEAKEVELGGEWDEASTRMEVGKVVTGSPLFPGESEYQVHYTLPVKGGAVELPIVAPAAIENLIVVVPADGARVTAKGLEGGQAVKMGEDRGAVRMYRAMDVPAGTKVVVAIGGIGKGWAGMRKMLMGAGFLLVLAGVGVMMMRRKKK